nr:MAG TPA: hypothetical protein [Caudoviricetes sp.]
MLLLLESVIKMPEESWIPSMTLKVITNFALASTINLLVTISVIFIGPNILSVTPRASIPWNSLNRNLRQKRFVSEMDGLMRIKGNTNKIVWIENHLTTLINVVYSHGIQMVDIDSQMKVITFDSKITAIVTNDYLITNMFPFSRTIESLIDVSIITKRFSSDSPVKFKIVVTLFECR